MKIKYQSSVKTQAGWRSVDVLAVADSVSAKMARIVDVLQIDGEKPGYKQSRTGAKRQQFNGLFVARLEVGKNKRLSSCRILEN